MKAIFLDIDGVINTSRMMRRRGKAHDEFDPEACAWINKLGEATAHQSGIVISSTWRHTHSLDQLAGILHANGITIQVVGRTPTIDGVLNRSRGQEIKRFLSFTRLNIDSYVVIDDDDHDIYPAVPEHRLVYTDHFTGFGKEDYLKAVEILNNKLHEDRSVLRLNSGMRIVRDEKAT